MWGNWTRRSGIRRASPARPQAHRPKDPAPPRRSREAEQAAGAGVASANPHPRHDSISSLSRPPYASDVKDRLNFSYKKLIVHCENLCPIRHGKIGPASVELINGVDDENDIREATANLSS